MQSTKGRDVLMQKCPMCGAMQEMIVNGHTTIDGFKLEIDSSCGYSFCNCNNIFFTQWNERFADVYDQSYVSKYNADGMNKYVQRYNVYLKQINAEHGFNGRKFIDIGSASDAVSDEAKLLGWDVSSFDIAKRESKHRFINGNFEDYKFNEKFDYIHASHVFEHFLKPIEALKKFRSLLNDDGFLFIAMPDTFFIDWRNPYNWAHWHVKEHHILWDMDSFCKLAEENGFYVYFKKHNCDMRFICFGDMHVMLRAK